MITRDCPVYRNYLQIISPIPFYLWINDKHDEKVYMPSNGYTYDCRKLLLKDTMPNQPAYTLHIEYDETELLEGEHVILNSFDTNFSDVMTKFSGEVVQLNDEQGTWLHNITGDVSDIKTDVDTILSKVDSIDINIDTIDDNILSTTTKVESIDTNLNSLVDKTITILNQNNSDDLYCAFGYIASTGSISSVEVKYCTENGTETSTTFSFNVLKGVYFANALVHSHPVTTGKQFFIVGNIMINEGTTRKIAKCANFTIPTASIDVIKVDCKSLILS